MITRFSTLIAVGLLLLTLTGCASGASELYGSYSTVNTPRSATLRLEKPNRYEFCYQTCSRGLFETRPLERNSGRIRFSGSPIERYVRQVEVDGYGVDSLEGKREFGDVELSYDIGFVFGTAIYIEPGSEVMFVKDD
jgi:hypothetical protein